MREDPRSMSRAILLHVLLATAAATWTESTDQWQEIEATPSRSGCPFTRLGSNTPCSTTKKAPRIDELIGIPGSAWTDREMLIVRAKLSRAFSPGEGTDTRDRIMEELYPDGIPYESWTGFRDGITAQKVLRLGFHDCMRYRDGSGGCDGCINWSGMGSRFTPQELEKGTLGGDTAGDTHNNGLRATVEVLEAIFSDPAFPRRTPTLSVSLKNSGKSRADLWAFAAMVAVEFAIETNNLVCSGVHDGVWSGQCNQKRGQPDCQIKLPRSFEFEWGRRDCARHGTKPYMSELVEKAPDASVNGTTTLAYFREEFGLSAREAVTLMGAHTIGRLHAPHGILRYTWTARNEHQFNNQYFRNIVGKKDWLFDDNDCTEVGDTNGERGKARWVTHVRGDTVVGGPVQWIQEKLTCVNCVKDKKLGYSKKDKAGNFCCKNVPANSPGLCVDHDNDPESGCEQWQFVMGVDETALPAEMGLYKKFEVDRDGWPTGCPGFTDFTRAVVGGPSKKDMDYKMSWSRQNGHTADTGCPLTNLAGIYEEFADNQTAFVAEFVPVLEKMLRNGVGAKKTAAKKKPAAKKSTVESHKSMKSNSVTCTRPEYDNDNRFWVCWDSTELSKPVTITNADLRTKSEALTVDPGTHEITFSPIQQPVAANQKWQAVSAGTGDFYVNVQTGAVLAINGVGEWRRDGDHLLAVGGGYSEQYALAAGKGSDGYKLQVWPIKDRKWDAYDWYLKEV